MLLNRFTLSGEKGTELVSERDLLWVSSVDGTPTHTSCSFQSFIQSSEMAEATLVKSIPFGAEGTRHFPITTGKGRGFVNYFSKKMESLRALPEVESGNLF